MMIGNEINVDITSAETSLNAVKDRMKQILKAASDMCKVPVALVYMQKDTDIRILASYGVCDESTISIAKKITGMLDPDNDLLIIPVIREHKEAATRVSDLEIEEIQFFAGESFRSETGNNIGGFCLCDSKPREVSEDQKQQLQVMADGVKNEFMLHILTELLNEKSRKLESYSALLKNSVDLTFILEPISGKISDVSNTVEKVLGYSPVMLRGKPFNDIVEAVELDDDTIGQCFSTEKQQKGRYSTSIQLIDSQDRKRWFHCNFSADENQWYVTARDISDEKEAEHGIFELKDKFEKIISVATDLIYELDWESGDLSWGDELTDVLGYPHTEKFVDYDWWLDKIHPNDLERVIHDVARTVEGESSKANFVYRIRTFDGSYKSVINRVYVDRNEDGTPENIIGAIVDVSELEIIKGYSQINKQILKELANSEWSVSWVRDENGTFLFINDKFSTLFELPSKKIVGKSVHDLFNDELANRFKANDQKALEARGPVCFEEQFRVNGKMRYFKTNIFPIKDVEGLGIVVAGVSIDLTEEKEKVKLIQHALEEKHVLLAEIHHRVKNNLAVVSGMMELQAYNETDERVQQIISASTGRIKTMATIHEQLYKSASFKYLRLDENIEQLITDITNIYNGSVDLTISYDMEPIKLNINDAIPCSLILNEVITNIYKHAYDDEDSGLLEVYLYEEDETVTLKIRDDGKEAVQV